MSLYGRTGIKVKIVDSFEVNEFISKHDKKIIDIKPVYCNNAGAPMIMVIYTD